MPANALGIDIDKIKALGNAAKDKRAAAEANSLTGGVANTGTGGLIEENASYKGGFLGLEDKGMKKYNVNDAAWRNQAGGVQHALDDRYKNLTGAGGEAMYSQGRQAAGVAADPQARNQQQQLAQLLFSQANGLGPSAAQAQLQAGNAAAINAQMAMARSGGNPNAMRGAMFNAASLTQQNANAAAQLRANEMLSGRQLLGSTLQGVRDQDLAQRGQDIGQNQFNAQLGQQNDQYNSTLQLQNRQFVEDSISRYLTMGKDIAEANRLAQIDLQKTKYAAATGAEAQRIGADTHGADTMNAFFGGLIKSGADAGMAYATGGASKAAQAAPKG